jgi:hypothetical protein
MSVSPCLGGFVGNEVGFGGVLPYNVVRFVPGIFLFSGAGRYCSPRHGMPCHSRNETNNVVGSA